MEKFILALLSLFNLNISLPVKDGHSNQMTQAVNELQYDGPYVFYNKKEVLINYIVEDSGARAVKTENVSMQQKNNLLLNVMTDVQGESFKVQLKKDLQVEKSEFSKVKKLLVLSDIEGNFAAFRKLLEANGVMDEKFDWTFGDGNLVLVGDFFDRGTQVTEVLWLIYSLEDKAKAAGGYVHFVLGNHEIMNLSGDLRYLPQKYIDNATLLKHDYVSMYDKNSELGRWLRTKNVVEKIGHILFAHGGISSYINRINTSVHEINNLARPYYDDTTYKYADQRSDIIFSDLGPFWYRGYYAKNNPDIPLQIDSTLSQFNVNHIVTGHTIVADTISVWYSGKLLNTDVHHTAGKSEALLVEEDKFYRVNAEGNKVLLMDSR